MNIGTARITMTPDIQIFLHAMHDRHTPEPEKQSMRNGTAGHIPFDSTELPVKKLIHRVSTAICAILGRSDWGYVGLWSTRLPKGGYHVKHTHPEGWMSGICYVDVPSIDSGHLEFEGRAIRPETGDIVLFPSDTVHGVSLYEGDAPRLTVAFDIIPVRHAA